jgi:hypothetical protein
MQSNLDSQLAKSIKTMMLASGNRPPHLPNRVVVRADGKSSIEVFLHRKSPDIIGLQVMRQRTRECGFIKADSTGRLMASLDLSIAAFFKPDTLIKKIRASLIDEEAKTFFDMVMTASASR